MALVVLGINHKSAPVEVRERLAFDPKHLREAAEQVFQNVNGVDEKVILSTCNRVEIYAHSSDVEEGLGALKQFLYRFHEIPDGSLEEYFYTYAADDAVKHLFEVSSALDSMVLGEPQILGQVKEAYQSAREVQATGKVLNQLFEKAFNVAKRVRTETSIAAKAVSISYAAVELASKIFGDLKGRTVLLIGAGEMVELAGKHLVNQGVKTILVANRSYDRAATLATELGGSAVHYEQFGEELKKADIVLSSTAAPHYVIHKETVEKAVKQRSGKPIFLIDIAVPRDIEPAVNDLHNVFLYDIDDLQSVVNANLAEREKEADKARDIITAEVGNFVNWMERLEVEPTIAAIRRKAEEIKNKELDKTFARLELDKPQKQAIEMMASSIVNKLLHDPTIQIKRHVAAREDGPAEGKKPHSVSDLVRELFNLD